MRSVESNIELVTGFSLILFCAWISKRFLKISRLSFQNYQYHLSFFRSIVILVKFNLIYIWILNIGMVMLIRYIDKFWDSFFRIHLQQKIIYFRSPHPWLNKLYSPWWVQKYISFLYIENSMDKMMKYLIHDVLET